MHVSRKYFRYVCPASAAPVGKEMRHNAGTAPQPKAHTKEGQSEHLHLARRSSSSRSLWSGNRTQSGDVSAVTQGGLKLPDLCAAKSVGKG